MGDLEGGKRDPRLKAWETGAGDGRGPRVVPRAAHLSASRLARVEPSSTVSVLICSAGSSMKPSSTGAPRSDISSPTPPTSKPWSPSGCDRTDTPVKCRTPAPPVPALVFLYRSRVYTAAVTYFTRDENKPDGGSGIGITL